MDNSIKKALRGQIEGIVREVVGEMFGSSAKTRKPMSNATKAKMRAAQKARWAKVKKTKS